MPIFNITMRLRVEYAASTLYQYATKRKATFNHRIISY